MVKLYLLVFRINVNRVNREAEPLDLRYRAEPGNEETDSFFCWYRSLDPP